MYLEAAESTDTAEKIRALQLAMGYQPDKRRIDSVSVRCDRGTAGGDGYSVGAVWRVPESWAKCGVYIAGERGTTFTFLEHPAGTPGAPLTRQ